MLNLYTNCSSPQFGMPFKSNEAQQAVRFRPHHRPTALENTMRRYVNGNTATRNSLAKQFNLIPVDKYPKYNQAFIALSTGEQDTLLQCMDDSNVQYDNTFLTAIGMLDGDESTQIFSA